MILSHTISLENTRQFSNIFIDYINQKPELDAFYGLFPKLENFKTQIENKHSSHENRTVLKDALKSQYSHIEIAELVKRNIDSITDTKTFTVTTGHQLCLFTGPLYFIFKIVSTIKLCRLLNEQFPAYNFLPIYWMASEDHDFEEINHFSLFGKKYEWLTNQKGPVGLFETNQIKEVLAILPQAMPLFENAYLKHNNLADATRYLINELFGEHGLIVIDGNDKALKNIFKESIIEELISNKTFENVNNATDRLEKLGYSAQISPREINLFYIEKGLRERIVLENDIYKVLNTNKEFAREEILDLVKSNPEKFSPNVVLRPLYQEVILPNLAYIGGPGELAYWLQLKEMFANQKVQFPILMPRNFGLVATQTQLSKLEKQGMELADLFLEENDLKKLYLSKKQTDVWDDVLYKNEINQVYDKMKSEAARLDRTLEGFMEAQRNEAHKILENISKKMRKTSEMKEKEGIDQLMNLKSKLFPNGGLQERNDNFMNFYAKNPMFINELVEVFDPFQFEMNMIVAD